MVPRLGLGAQRVQPVAADDIALAVARIFERDGAWERMLEIGGPEVMTMAEILNTLMEVTGRRRLVVPVPATLAKIVTAPLTLLPNPPMTPQGIEFAVQDGIVDASELEEVTGVHPVGLREGLDAMFDSLSGRLDDIFTRLRARGRLSDKQVDEVLREIRLALLEADVSLRVVKAFVADVRERAAGAEIHKSLTPAQQVIKFVHGALVDILGREAVGLTHSPRPPRVIVMAGLQGSGKTTAAAKLGRRLKAEGRRPLLAACDQARYGPPNALPSAQACREALDTAQLVLGGR